MRRTGPIRAALISLAGAGLGYVYVGRIRLAIVFAVLSISIMAAAGWTRLILHPLGTYIFAGCAILTVVVPILHSAFIAHRQRSIPRKTYNRWWIYLLWAAGSWLLIEAYLGLRADWFGFEPFRVPARSMVPTLDRGDYIMADTWHFDRADPEYGELVVFEAPGSAGVFYVKRLIGLPDDRVEIRDDVLYRNGRAIAESYISLSAEGSGVLSNVPVLVVPENSYFVLGDNRHNSRDSRFFGPVPRALLHGRVEHRWFAYDGKVRWERFPQRFAAGSRE